VNRPTFRHFSRYQLPLVTTFAVTVTAVFSLPPLTISGASGVVPAATLRTSMGYDLIAPVSNVLDAMTLLTPSQHIATFALCAVVFLVSRCRSLPRTRLHAKARTLAGLAVVFTAAFVVVIGAMLIVPRPMASLQLNDHDLVVVDFHSHTSASHDGRPGFDSEKNREWHRSSGFNVAYITDHRTFAGAIDGGERNPSNGGIGVVLLPGVELRDRGEHPILLGVDPTRTKITSPDWPGTIVTPAPGSVPPVLVLSMPGNLNRVPAQESVGSVRLAGIEESDASPRGMAQTARDRRRIEDLSNARGLALVSGSDNHGWGRTAAGWTVMRIPGWQTMPPQVIDAAIRSTLVRNAPGSIGVITRRTATSGTGEVQQALAGIAVIVTLLRVMNLRDRFSWVAWSWLAQLLAVLQAKRKRRRLRLLLPGRVRELAARPLVEVAALEAAS
jgi:hypothetical protein